MAARLAPNDPLPPYRIARMGLWLGGDDGETESGSPGRVWSA